VQHRAALAWFDSVGDGEAVVCRVVQLGLLRHLTNPYILKDEVVSLSGAMAVWDHILRDRRIRFLVDEPPGLDRILRQSLVVRDAGHNVWTDAYLAAFAQAYSLKFATFDRGFRSFAGLDLVLLESS